MPVHGSLRPYMKFERSSFLPFCAGAITSTPERFAPSFDGHLVENVAKLLKLQAVAVMLGANNVVASDSGLAIEQEVYFPQLTKPSIFVRANKNIGIDNVETSYAPIHQKIYTCQGVYCALGI